MDIERDRGTRDGKAELVVDDGGGYVVRGEDGTGTSDGTDVVYA